MTNIPFNGTPAQEQELRKMLHDLRESGGTAMMALQRAQDIYDYLPIEVQSIISEELDIPLQELYGIATFYSQFSLYPKGKYRIGVCIGTACYVKGGGQIFEKFKELLKIDDKQTTADAKFSLEGTRCIGCCGLAPVLTVNDEVYGKVVVDDVPKILAKCE